MTSLYIYTRASRRNGRPGAAQQFSMGTRALAYRGIPKTARGGVYIYRGGSRWNDVADDSGEKSEQVQGREFR